MRLSLLVGAMRHYFNVEQWVPFQIEPVFAFFADPNNLAKLMPGWQRPRIESANYIAPVRPGDLKPIEGMAGEGSRFTFSFRPFPLSPIRLRWEAYIAEFCWNDHFCDEQIKGPFRYWRHCHRVSTQRRGDTPGVVVRDEVAYELPFDALSNQIESIFVAPQIRAMFKFRQARLEQQLREAL
ncbi:MAG TPA: SRPBCC family protein [Acidisarcina sp.]